MKFCPIRPGFSTSPATTSFSLDEKISNDLREVLNWWTHQHISRRFDYRDLPITRQQDSYSCGLLGGLALVAFLSKGKETLVDPSCVVQGRLKVLRVAEKRHKDMVQAYCFH